MSTQGLTSEYAWFIHTNISYNAMLIPKAKQISHYMVEISCLGRNATTGFHWGIFSSEDPSEGSAAAGSTFVCPGVLQLWQAMGNGTGVPGGP